MHKKFKAVCAALLAGMMMISMGSSVFAETDLTIDLTENADAVEDTIDIDLANEEQGEGDSSVEEISPADEGIMIDVDSEAPAEEGVSGEFANGLTKEEQPTGLHFENNYKANGSITLRAWKDLQGRALTAGEFSFDLLDKDGKLIETKTNLADGSVAFDTLNFTEKDIGKTFYYGIREQVGNDPTVTYDESSYGYKVQVLDNGDGTLQVVTGFATPIMGPGQMPPVANDAVKYAVQLYGIGEAVDENGDPMGLTFGPAVGANYIQSYHSHTPSGTTLKGNEKRCIHNDDWATIIHWNNEDPEVYRDCIAEGCTHSILLDLSDEIKNPYFKPDALSLETGDGPGTLCYELCNDDDIVEEQHVTWNPLETPSDAYGTSEGGWGASRIRAMMNGADELTMSTSSALRYADGTRDINFPVEDYTSANCLLSAFPVELQTAIGKQAIKYDSAYDAKTAENSKTSYDKLWLLSSNEIWTSTQNADEHYAHPLEGVPYSRFADNTAAYADVSQPFLEMYGVDAHQSYSPNMEHFEWWLRSTSSYYDGEILIVYGDGCMGIENANTHSMGASSSVGVSPCFSLSANAPVYVPDDVVIGWDTEHGSLPVFTNTLKDGDLKITKTVTNAENADPDQTFHFKIKLVGIDDSKSFEYDFEEYKKPTITVTYDGKGGYFNGITDQTENILTYRLQPDETYLLDDGEVLTPVRDGYVFAGWFSDPEYTTAWDTTTIPSGDQMVYAKWASYDLSMLSSVNDTPASGDAYAKDEVVDIRHTITNNGTETITGAVVSSAATGLNQTIASIASGETVTVDDHLTVTSAMIAADTGSYDLTTSITYDAGGNSVTKTSTLPVPVARPAKIKYAVQVYDIGKAVDRSGNAMGLTFGPAVGANYINSYHSHTPSGTTTAGNEHRCIHNDDWNTIISWNNTDPAVYEQCIAEGCTHSVELSLSENLKNASFDPSYTTGDGPGVLYYELYKDSNDQHLRWNPLTEGGSTSSGTNYGGWGASRIRAMLNGADELTMKTADSGYCSNASGVTFDVENYTGSDTLIAAFPQELQAAIGEQAVKYDSVYNSKTEANLKTSYDKLWLLSPNEIAESVTTTNYNHPLEASSVYSKFIGAGTHDNSTGNAMRTGYSISSTSGNSTGLAFFWWLRSSNGSGNSYVLNVRSSGFVNNYNPYNFSGVAPCFSLKVSH